MKNSVTHPAWLEPGALVWCGFAAVVREVAVSDTTILVKVESPKRAALGQREEWLPYYPGVMEHLTRKQAEEDIARYRHLLQQRLDEFAAVADELTGATKNGRT